MWDPHPPLSKVSATQNPDIHFTSVPVAQGHSQYPDEDHVEEEDDPNDDPARREPSCTVPFSPGRTRLNALDREWELYTGLDDGYRASGCEWSW